MIDGYHVFDPEECDACLNLPLPRPGEGPLFVDHATSSSDELRHTWSPAAAKIHRTSTDVMQELAFGGGR